MSWTRGRPAGGSASRRRARRPSETEPAPTCGAPTSHHRLPTPRPWLAHGAGGLVLHQLPRGRPALVPHEESVGRALEVAGVDQAVDGRPVEAAVADVECETGARVEFVLAQRGLHRAVDL